MSTREQILDAALRVFLDEGYRSATTRRIAAEAGVNEVTLFRQFGTKDSLLLEALRYDALASALPLRGDAPDPEAELVAWAQAAARRLARVRGLIRASMDKLDADPQLCASAHEGPLRMRAQLASFFEFLRERGIATGDWAPEVVAKLVMGALFGEIMRGDAPQPPVVSELDATSAAYARLVLRAVGFQSMRGNE